MRKILPDLRYDLPASLVVFLVALPLSLGIAIASGAPLMAGLIAAVSGGIIAGSVGGSVLQVSGPAAGLTVVVAGLIDEFGWEMTCVITVCAGAVQILLGLVRVARAALAVAPVVVHAMLAGIGVTIVLQQIHVLLGGSSRSSAWANIEALPSGILNHELHEVIVGSVVIAILLLWPKLPPKVRFIPGAWWRSWRLPRCRCWWTCRWSESNCRATSSKPSACRTCRRWRRVGSHGRRRSAPLRSAW